MQASGGVATAREAAQKPLFTIGSGPVGGVIGSKFLADTLSHFNVIASDVGGTSFDVGIISNGQPLTSSETIGCFGCSSWHITANHCARGVGHFQNVGVLIRQTTAQ
jgi:N-methylhydantoinase A/oxoprolinase/acetone carboxylase beta subunit